MVRPVPSCYKEDDPYHLYLPGSHGVRAVLAPSCCKCKEQGRGGVHHVRRRTVQYRQREGLCPSTVMSLESGTVECGSTTMAW